MKKGDWTMSMEKATIKITKQILKSAKWNFQDWIKHYSWYWKGIGWSKYQIRHSWTENNWTKK